MVRSRIFGIGVPLLALAMVASANPFSFATSSGATETGGNAVSASAVVTTGAGTVTVTLNNLFVNPLTVAQNLSDFAFTLSGTGFGSGTLGSSSGQEVTVAGGGGGITLGNSVATGWIVTGTGGSYKLDDLNGGAGPKHTIIGAPGGATYSNANSSIAGNGPHNAFLNQTASFTLNITGVTATTVVSGATFSFGTESGDEVTGCLVGAASCTSSTVPEPVSLSLVGAGLLGLGLFRKRLPRR